MTIPDGKTLSARGIYRHWRRLPNPVRQLIGTALDAFHLRTPLANLFVPNPNSNGFFTFCPQTPPAIYKSLQRVSEAGPAGDYYEFGLYRGYTFWYAQRSADLLGLKGMRFFGFDSFEGLPALKGPDVGGEFSQGDYAASREEVQRYLSKYGVDWSRTYLIEGYYEDSLNPQAKTKLRMKTASVVLIDCDLYHSTVPVLQFLDDLLQDGSILLFDDWNNFQGSDEKGERRAFHEFLGERPYWHAEPYISFGWHGQAFILRSRNR
jgi:O-methyltransferase